MCIVCKWNIFHAALGPLQIRGSWRIHGDCEMNSQQELRKHCSYYQRKNIQWDMLSFLYNNGSQVIIIGIWAT